MLDLENNEIGEEENADDVELKGKDVVTWGKKNRLYVVLHEYRLEVLCQQHDSQVAEHRSKYSTQELIAWNFTCDKWT